MQIGFGSAGGFAPAGTRPGNGDALMKPVTLRKGPDPLLGPGGLGAFLSQGDFPKDKKSEPAAAPPQETSGGKSRKLADRLCVILGKFRDREVNEDVAARIFWSYVDDARIPPSIAAQMILDRCPDLKIPAKPVTPAKELKKAEKDGFHGKTEITFGEASELLDLLTVVLAPLTPEEAASQIADRECLRELNDAGGFPIVERLQERLMSFLETATPEDMFTISHGESVVTGKAVECAEALGRIKTIKTVAVVGGITVGSTALLFLLGLI